MPVEITVKGLIEIRLLSTLELVRGLNVNILELTLEETKALHGFDGKEDKDLSTLEKSYLADLTAAAIVRYALDRYKEDAKAVLGGEGLVKEAQNKLAYLQDMLTRFESQAQFLAGRLGLVQAGTVPPVIGKSIAKDESEGLS
jgi:hypothetical protein